MEMKSKVNKMGVTDASTLTQKNNGLTITNCGKCKKKCKTCQMQYVGKTVQALRKHMYNHKSTLKEHKINTVLCQH